MTTEEAENAFLHLASTQVVYGMDVHPAQIYVSIGMECGKYMCDTQTHNIYTHARTHSLIHSLIYIYI